MLRSLSLLSFAGHRDGYQSVKDHGCCSRLTVGDRTISLYCSEKRVGVDYSCGSGGVQVDSAAGFTWFLLFR